MAQRKSQIRVAQRTLVCLVGVWALAFGGCGKPPNPALDPAVLKEIVPIRVPEPASPPPDNSLTAEQYVERGLPAIDRVWAPADVVQVAKIFGTFTAAQYRDLPRYESQRSGKVFARITSPRNIEILEDPTWPLKMRLEQALGYIQGNKQLLKVYMSALANKDVGGTELVELMGSHLRMTVTLLKLVDEFVPTLDKNDPTYPVRMQGLEQMKQGLGGIVVGSLAMLTERQIYQVGDLVRFVGYARETLPILIPRTGPATRAEAMARLEKMQSDPAMNDLQPGLGELLSKVKDALAKQDVDAADSATTNPAAVPANSSPLADESLTTEQYIDRGLPAPDRVWSKDDLAQAAKVLGSFTAAEHRELPRYESPRSGEVFARITSPRNLDALRDENVSPATRLIQASNYVDDLKRIMKLYTNAFGIAVVDTSEVVELLGAQLRSTVVLVENLDEFVRTLDKNDPTYPARTQALERISDKIGRSVVGSLALVKDFLSIRKRELDRLVDYMQETLPTIVPQLPVSFRTKTLSELEKMLTDPTMKGLQPGLERLQSKIKAALAKADASELNAAPANGNAAP